MKRGVVVCAAVAAALAGAGNAGALSPTSWLVASPATVVADGTSTATLTLHLRDATNTPLVGRTVSFTTAGSHATFSLPVAVTDATGTAIVAVKDAVPESVTVTATDVTSGLPLAAAQTTVTFAPPAPTLTAPGAVLGTTVNVAGKALPGATVSVADAGGLLVTFVADATGSYAGSVLVAYGSHDLVATQVLNGVASAASPTVTVMAAPSALTVLSPADGSSTTSPSVEIAGTWAPGGVVTVVESGGTLATLVVDATGRYDGVVTLGYGAHTLILSGILSGNGIFLSSGQTTLHVDVAVPPPVVTAPVDGSSLASPMIEFVGTALPLATVFITDGGTTFNTVADASGAFDTIAYLGWGAHTIEVTQSVFDPVGQTAVTSAPVTLHLDVAVPPPAVTAPLDEASQASPMVEFVGTALPNQTVEVVDTVGGNTSTYTASVDSQGTFDTSEYIGYGTHTIAVTQFVFDTVTGTIVSSRPVTLHLDVLVPPPLVTAPVDGASTTSPAVEFVGTATPNQSVNIVDTVGGDTSTFLIPVDSSGRFDSIVQLGYGSHTIDVTQTVFDGVQPATSSAVTLHLDVRDPTPPVITESTTGPTGNGGWYTGDVHVSWTVSDPESAVTSTTGCEPTTVSSDTAGTDLTCSATSAGGTSSKTVTVRRDAAAPTIAASPGRAPNANGWYGAPVTVTFACADVLSGIASCPSAVTLGEGKAQAVTGFASDVAGNTAGTTLSGLNVDTTPPVVSYTGNAGSYSVDQTVTISCSATDALSGIATSTCAPITGPAWGFGVGTTTRSASATDLAGNAASASVTFTVGVTCNALTNLVAAWVANPGIAGSLAAKIASICTAPNAAAKSGKLGAFDNAVAAQRGKAIAADKADLLARLAAAL